MPEVWADEFGVKLRWVLEMTQLGKLVTRYNWVMVDEESNERLEKANQWLGRAFDDFAAFKKLVGHFDNKTKGIIAYSDAPMAVYLLQQCIEKMAKAEIIASFFPTSL